MYSVTLCLYSIFRLCVCVCVTSLHTNMVPKTTCRPSKKLSPIRMTVAPPVVQPSLGLMALMQGVAAGRGRWQVEGGGGERKERQRRDKVEGGGGEEEGEDVII